MYAEYDPDEGECGGYRAFAGEDVGESDVVVCMGLPERQHVNFPLVWWWSSGGNAPTATYTAPVTPMLCAGCTHLLYLPVIRK